MGMILQAGPRGMRTYIVVAVFDQEGYPLALCTGAIAVPLQLVLCSRDVVDELSIGKGAARQRVDHGRALRIVFLDGLEDGQAGQCRRHSHQVQGRRGERKGAVDVVGRQGCFVSGKGAREKVPRPHGGKRCGISPGRCRFRVRQTDG
jgi:hypothetical protein